MSEQIPDLWPGGIVTKVLSPVAILKQQAEKLREHTQGLLEAKVSTVLSKTSKNWHHDFQILAPSLGYTYTLFSAWHGKEFIYPVTLKFRQWDDQAAAAYHQSRAEDTARRFVLSIYDTPPDGNRSADSPSEMIEFLKDILGSSQTKAVLMSLIAQINDAETASNTTTESAASDASS